MKKNSSCSHFIALGMFITTYKHKIHFYKHNFQNEMRKSIGLVLPSEDLRYLGREGCKIWLRVDLLLNPKGHFHYDYINCLI